MKALGQKFCEDLLGPRMKHRIRDRYRVEAERRRGLCQCPLDIARRRQKSRSA